MTTPHRQIREFKMDPPTRNRKGFPARTEKGPQQKTARTPGTDRHPAQIEKVSLHKVKGIRNTHIEKGFPTQIEKDSQHESKGIASSNQALPERKERDSPMQEPGTDTKPLPYM